MSGDHEREPARSGRSDQDEPNADPEPTRGSGSGTSGPDDRPAARPHSDRRPVLPDRASDETEVGWGDDPEAGRRDADWYRRERPPHHG